MRLIRDLEAVVGKKVDVVTATGLKARIRDKVLQFVALLKMPVKLLVGAFVDTSGLIELSAKVFTHAGEPVKPLVGTFVDARGAVKRSVGAFV